MPMAEPHGGPIQLSTLHSWILGHTKVSQGDPCCSATFEAQRLETPCEVPPTAHHYCLHGGTAALQEEKCRQPAWFPQPEDSRDTKRHMERANATAVSDWAASRAADSPECV